MKTFARILFASVVLLRAAPAQDVNDFFSGNGSFELGPFINPLTFTGAGVSFDVPGWLLYDAGRKPQWFEGPQAQDGNRYIELTGRGGSDPVDALMEVQGLSISHTPFTLGQAYELVFWAAGGVASAPVNRLQVSLSGTLLGGGINNFKIDLPSYTEAEFAALSDLEWGEYTIPFIATVTSPTLSLIPRANETGGTSTIYLDNFSFRVVPEPGSALLLLAGGGWLVMGRRRRGGPNGVS